jgi:hypothetical protein
MSDNSSILYAAQVNIIIPNHIHCTSFELGLLSERISERAWSLSFQISETCIKPLKPIDDYTYRPFKQ